MTDKILIRPSSTTGWLDCPRRAAAGLFRKEIEGAGYTLRGGNRNVGAAVGTSVHKAAWYTLTEKLRSGEIGEDRDAIDLAHTTFREEIADGVMWDGATGTINDADKQIDRMARMYRNRIAPDVQPLAVEERLEATVGNVVISGQKDVLCREPSDLRDLKTGVGRASHAAQLGCYSLIDRSHGNDVTGLKEDFIPRVSVRKPQPIPTTLSYDIAVCENLAMDVIYDIADSVQEFRRRLIDGDAPPENAFRPNPSSVLCSEKYCPAHGTHFCRAHRPTGDE